MRWPTSTRRRHRRFRANGVPCVAPMTCSRIMPAAERDRPARHPQKRATLRVVLCAAGARRLYAQQSSAQVASGASATSVCSSGSWMGDCQPPPLGNGTTVPSARNRNTQRWVVRALSANSAASSSYVPSPASYARITRWRRLLQQATLKARYSARR